MKHGILMHEPDDDVGVAVEDLSAGAEVGVITLEGAPVGTVTLVDDVPLGHKVAMRDLTGGKDVIAVRPGDRGGDSGRTARVPRPHPQHQDQEVDRMITPQDLHSPGIAAPTGASASAIMS